MMRFVPPSLVFILAAGEVFNVSCLEVVVTIATEKEGIPCHEEHDGPCTV